MLEPTPPRPLTPCSERVATILRVFKACQNGSLPSEPWTVYKLNRREYEDLQRRLEDDVELWGYVQDKVLFDYDPIHSKLIIRMETALHVTFASGLEKEIEKRFERLAKDQVETRPFIEKISSVGGAIYFEEDGQKFIHVPDIRFHHEDAAWPGVVIEVAYSQKRKSLVDLAENYLLTSKGGIRVMVGIDVEYKKAKEAGISIWRLKTWLGDDGQPTGEVFQELDSELFRDAEGNPILSSSGLKLPLKDFAVQALSNRLPDSFVEVDPETMCTLLAKAEKWDDKSRLLQGVQPGQIKLNYPQRPPAEQLTMADEEKFLEKERSVRRKAKKEDKSYSEEGLFSEPSSPETI